MVTDSSATEPRPARTVRGQYSREALLRLAIGFTLVQLLVAWSIDGVSPSADLRQALRWDWRIAIGTVAALGVGAIAGIGIAILIRRSPPFGTIAERVVPLADWASFRPVDYVLIAACAGLGEEVLFRGALQPVTGVIIQAVLFGLLHWTCRAHVGIAVSAGLVFGFLAQVSGSVWPGVAAHFSVDLTMGLALGAALRRGWIDAAGRFIATEPATPAPPPTPAV
ncbi:MAG: CPBP family intramembrane metalloprotease [Deltaproteobacteria bacterium]|nr:CPBP family intramembrane metalloprotease [Deltaproteobacteria bacterium]